MRLYTWTALVALQMIAALEVTHPESAQSPNDFNFDGYVAWLLNTDVSIISNAEFQYFPFPVRLDITTDSEYDEHCSASERPYCYPAEGETATTANVCAPGHQTCQLQCPHHKQPLKAFIQPLQFFVSSETETLKQGKRRCRVVQKGNSLKFERSPVAVNHCNNGSSQPFIKLNYTHTFSYSYTVSFAVQPRLKDSR